MHLKNLFPHERNKPGTMYMCCSDFLSRELYTRRLDGGTSYSCCPSHFRIQQATIFECSWLKTECSMIIGTMPFPSGIGILLAIFEKVLASQWGAPVRMLCSLSPLTQFSFRIVSDVRYALHFQVFLHPIPLSSSCYPYRLFPQWFT